MKNHWLDALASKEPPCPEAPVISPTCNTAPAERVPQNTAAFSDSLKEKLNQWSKLKTGAQNLGNKEDVTKLKESMTQALSTPDNMKSPISNMGFAGHPFTIATKAIPRTFRFLLQPKSHPDLSYMVKKVTVNYYQKKIEAEIYEHPDFLTHDYLLYLSDSQNKDHELTLTALDGCGQKLYLLHFKGVEPDDHSVEYDYAKSDVLTHKLKLTYQEMKRIDNKH